MLVNKFAPADARVGGCRHYRYNPKSTSGECRQTLEHYEAQITTDQTEPSRSCNPSVTLLIIPPRNSAVMVRHPEQEDQRAHRL